MMRLLSSLLKDRCGAAATEMALVTPLLLLIMIVAFEAGNFFWSEHIVVKAVRDGARYAGRQSFNKFSCAAITDSATETAIKTLTRTGSPTGTTPKISGWTDAQISVSVSCTGAAEQGIYASNAGNAPRVTVSATVPYTTLFGSYIFKTALNLQASSQASVMGI